MYSDYTIVVGVDAHHLEQLSWSWKTWKKHKPSLLEVPMVVFFDRDQIERARQVFAVIDHPNLDVIAWPLPGIQYSGGNDKWTNAQRYKMLAGFIYVAAASVQTKYWLKLDTDAVATGMDDWIDPNWFVGDPAIIAQPWSFTKPPDQMLKLDDWVAECPTLLPELASHAPLNLKPREGEERLCHRRIASWCGFFLNNFTRDCADWASQTCGRYQLPAASQDGYFWYVAQRLGLPIVRQNFKKCGWQVWGSAKNVIRHSKEILGV